MKTILAATIISTLPLLIGCENTSISVNPKFVPDIDVIQTKGCDKNNHPNHVIQVALHYPTSGMVVTSDISEYDINTDGTMTAPTSVSPTSEHEYNNTPMNIDLKLGNTQGKKERVYIEVILDRNPAWRFNSIDIDGDRKADLAITSASSKKDKMFCRYIGDSSTYTSKFVTYYSKVEKFGNYNINVDIIPTVTNPDLIIPITIDPEVKNNG